MTRRPPRRTASGRSTGNIPLPHGPHFREPDSRSRTTGPHNCPVKVRRPTPVHSHWQQTARQWSDRSGPDAVGIEVEQQRHLRRPRAIREQLSEAGGGTGADTRPVSLQVAGQQQQPAGLVDLVVERRRVGFVEHPTHHPVRAAGRRSTRVALRRPAASTSAGCSALMTRTFDGSLQSAALVRAVRSRPHCSGRLTRVKPRRRSRGARASSTHGLITTAGPGRP